MDNNQLVEKPGEKALQAMKSLSKSVAIFKIPKLPSEKKKTKMKILTEERYIEELGKIIQKDFFPDLEKLKAQNQYLDAMEKNDVVKLRELYTLYSEKRPSTQTCGFESPVTFETPVTRPDETPNANDTDDTHLKSTRSNISTSSSATNVSKSSPSDGHSLDSFLSNFTSEDNHSFQEIIDTADRKLRQKFAVLYDAENNQAKQLAMALALPGIEDQFKAIEGPKQVDTWNYKNKNYIMYVPDGVDLMPEEKLEMAKRKQEIVYSNTRLQRNPFDEQQSKETISELAKSQVKGVSGKIGVDGNAISNNKPSNIRDFEFVRTPSPCPGVTDSPLMTWGEIEGTPFRLDGSDTPLRSSAGSSFRIAETSRRENIALELAEKAGERMRGQKAKAIQAARRNIASPYIRSTFDRLASMSPAARRLATSKRGIHDSILTPSPRRSGLGTPKGDMVRRATPSPLTPRARKCQVAISVASSSSGGGGSGGGSGGSNSKSSDLNGNSSKQQIFDGNAHSMMRNKASDFF